MSSNLPLALQKRGFYYGYIVLFAGTLGIIASLPGQTMGISVYTDHLVKAYGLDRLSLSICYLMGTLSSALLLPLAGRLLDRKGARFLAVLACTGLACSMLLLAFGPHLAGFLISVLGVPPTIASIGVVYLGFFGARHFGQGQLTIASRTMMARWFVKKRGLVLGISGVFVAFGFGITPYFLNSLIEAFSWKESLALLAAGLACIACIAYAIFRESPEAHGLAVDGGFSTDQLTTNSAKETDTEIDEVSVTLAEAKKTFVFWIFNIGIALHALFITGIAFNIADIGAEHGLSNAESFQIFIYIGFVAVAADLTAGYLSDRISLRFILAGLQAGLAAALFGFQYFGTVFGDSLIILGLGIASGTFSLLTAAAWPKLFGCKHLGSINGLVTAWMVGASALGPYILSQGKTLTGTYSAVLWLSLTLPIIMFFVALFVKQPSSSNRQNINTP